MSLRRTCPSFAALLVIGLSSKAFASSAGMPWEGPLQKIISSLTGPVAKAIGVAAIVLAGLGMALGESGGAVKNALRIVFGLAIAFTAAEFTASFFGASGGFAP
jgi:type IV secretory pathway VirB2 component (pilin)